MRRDMRIGFIGLGNVGGKLAGSILRSDFDLTVRDLDSELEHSFARKGATIGESPAQIACNVDILITCLPNPAASANVMEGEDGALYSDPKDKKHGGGSSKPIDNNLLHRWNCLGIGMNSGNINREFRV